MEWTENSSTLIATPLYGGPYGFMTLVVDVVLTAPFSCLTLGNPKLHSAVAQRLQRWSCPVPAHVCNVTHQVSAMQDLVCCKLGHCQCSHQHWHLIIVMSCQSASRQALDTLEGSSQGCAVSLAASKVSNLKPWLAWFDSLGCQKCHDRAHTLS